MPVFPTMIRNFFASYAKCLRNRGIVLEIWGASVTCVAGIKWRHAGGWDRTAFVLSQLYINLTMAIKDTRVEDYSISVWHTSRSWYGNHGCDARTGGAARMAYMQRFHLNRIL